MATGLQGTAHFRNDKAGFDFYEPLYQNLYSAQLIGYPAAHDKASGKSTYPVNIYKDQGLVIAGLQKVEGLDVEKLPVPVEQTYKGAKRSYAQSLPDKTYTDVKLTLAVNLNNENEAYIYNYFRSWCNLVWHPLTGEMQLKRDYVAKALMVSIYNRVGAVYRRMVFYDIFPSAPLNSYQLDYANGNSLYNLSVSLRADYWDDVAKGVSPY